MRQAWFTGAMSDAPNRELRPLARRGPDKVILLERWRSLPRLDPPAVRRDIDALIDASL